MIFKLSILVSILKNLLCVVLCVLWEMNPPRMERMERINAWWNYFPQSGALAEGTSRPVSRKHDHSVTVTVTVTKHDAGGSPPGAARDSARPPHDKKVALEP